MKRIVFVSLIGFIVGCSDESPIDSGPPFQITVVSQGGQPVEDAMVEGGIDWDAYQVQTDIAGVATLPGSARDKGATIYKTNSLPTSISRIEPAQYILQETLKQLNFIGNVVGKAVRFAPNEIITLDYGGAYHLYSYDDQSVSETFTVQLHDSAVAIKEIQLFGDTLWFTTHDSGIFVFSIQDPSSPLLLFRVPISGYLGPFAVKDSLVILGDPSNPGPLRVVSYCYSGECPEISRVENYFVRKMTRIGNAIVVLGNSESLPTVFDISNPSSPRLLYNGLEWEYKTGFFFNQQTILTPWYGSGGTNVRLVYKVLNFSDPANPTTGGSFAADSWITGLATDDYAYGNHYNHWATISVLNRDLTSFFVTVGTVSGGIIDGYGGDGVGGAFHPYYVIGNRLWKLIDR